MKIISGNELGWLLRLAENYYDSKTFREWIKEYDKEGKLDAFLKLVLCKFHPNNFSAGTSKDIWYLIKEADLGVGVVSEQKKEKHP